MLISEYARTYSCEQNEWPEQLTHTLFYRKCITLEKQEDEAFGFEVQVRWPSLSFICVSYILSFGLNLTAGDWI